jgi:hypothetical protein
VQDRIDGDATNATAVTAEATARTAADVVLQGAIDAEATTRGAADTVLQGNIDSEATARAAADTTNANAITAETTRATAAEGINSAAIISEATARTAADTALDGRVTTVEGQVSGKIGDLTTLTTDTKSSLVAAINEVDANVGAEATARAAADAAIRTDYNARNFTFQSAAAATTHVVTHNLDSAFVSFTIMIEREDGTYRNDIVSVAETSSNVLTVYLSESSKIKLSVHSMVGL